MKFITQNSSRVTIHIGYKEKYIGETNNTEFLGPEIDNNIKWRNERQLADRLKRCRL